MKETMYIFHWEWESTLKLNNNNKRRTMKMSKIKVQGSVMNTFIKIGQINVNEALIKMMSTSLFLRISKSGGWKVVQVLGHLPCSR